MKKTRFVHLMFVLSSNRALARFLPVLALVAVGVLLGIDLAQAQSIDSLGGSNIGSKLCTFGKSVDNSTLGKGIAVAVFGWGVVRWLPTRKDGIPEMIGGVLAFLVVSKFNTILSMFGLSC